MKTKVIVGLLAVLGMTMLASAGVTVTGNAPGDGVLVTNAGGVNCMTYVVSIAVPTGEKIAAVDLRFTGVMRQAGLFTYDADAEAYVGPIKLTPYLSDSTSTKDTHLMLNAADVLAVNVSENNDYAGAPIGPGAAYGNGSLLTAIFGVEREKQVQVMQLAQIVIPIGSNPVILSGSISTNNAQMYTVNALIPTPEPMTISMLVLGGLGLLRRRMA